MDIKKILESIKEMKVIELNELVKAIEEEFGVSAAIPTAAASEVAVSTEKKVVLTDFGTNKVAAIKIVRELLNLGLMEAKAFVEKLPATLAEEATVEKAQELIKKFEEIGATVVAQ